MENIRVSVAIGGNVNTKGEPLLIILNPGS